MAGDWVKIENVTPDKPEVFAVADVLNIDPDAVVGKLIRIWVWADQQTTDGKVSRSCHALRVTHSLIDRLTSVTGFAKALAAVGWLRDENGVLTFPNFDRHNGETSKQRALAAKRQAKKRSRNSHDASVTKTLPEKRREEIVSTNVLTKTEKPKPRAFQVDDIEFPEGMDTATVKAAVGEWLSYKRAKGKGYKSARQVEILIGKWLMPGPAAFVDAIENSIANNYDGVFPGGPRTAAPGQARESHEQARERANHEAIAGFLRSSGVCEGDADAHGAQANRQPHRAAIESVARRVGDVQARDD